MTKKKAPSKKPAAKPAEDSLEERVAALEAKQSLLSKGLRWAADEIKPMFGLTHVGRVFEELAEKLK